MNQLYAVYACDLHRSHNSLRLLTAINKDDEQDVELLGSLIRTTLVENGDATHHDFSNVELVQKAIDQEIDYLHIEAISPLTELKNTFTF